MASLSHAEVYNSYKLSCAPFGGTTFLIWYQLQYCVCNLICFSHPPLQDCLIPCALVSLKYFSRFRRVTSSEPMEEWQVCIYHALNYTLDFSVHFPLESSRRNYKLLIIFLILLYNQELLKCIQVAYVCKYLLKIVLHKLF